MRQVGDIVQFANVTVNDFDRTILTPLSPKKIIRVNTSEKVPHYGWDYEIEARDGNHFFVYEYEIEDFYLHHEVQGIDEFGDPYDLEPVESFRPSSY